MAPGGYYLKLINPNRFGNIMRRIVQIIIFLVVIAIVSVNYLSNMGSVPIPGETESEKIQRITEERGIGIEIPLTTAIANGMIDLTKVQQVRVDKSIQYVYEGCQYKNPNDGLNKCVIKTVEVIEVTENNCLVKTAEGFSVDIGSCDAQTGEFIFAVYDPNDN